MLKKLRKTLGDVNSPSCVALRDLIDTQSKNTIRKWCLGYAEDKVLPIFEKPLLSRQDSLLRFLQKRFRTELTRFSVRGLINGRHQIILAIWRSE